MGQSLSDLSHLHAQALDFWLARGAVVAVAALQLLVVNDLTVGPRWLAPALEMALLAPLSVATAWNMGHARRARTDDHWAIVARHRRAIRNLALILTATVTVMNIGALIRLVLALLEGTAGGGTTLLLDALNIWFTNVIVFALWFWNLDRSGPALRGLHKQAVADFLFPQMTLDPARWDARFSPGFVDYLFLSFTNATAFSPTDTMPLSQRAKLLMMAEASISLLTIALVAARAVNILR